MEIVDIIKEAFVFPYQNLEKLAIYIVLTFVIGLLIACGIFAFIFAISNNSIFLVLTAVLAIVAIALGLIISGYQVGIIKTGIDQVPDAPSFDWMNDLVTGIKLLVVAIVYFIIPTIVVIVMALVTNIPGQLVEIGKQAALAPANATAVANSTGAVSTVSNAAIASLGTSIAITALVGLVLFIIFAFLETMGEARLANTGDLVEAINIAEAFKDITRIGVGKVVAVVILSIVIVMVINGILSYLCGQVPQLTILSVIVTPYLIFFTHRVTGLLYSDIA